MMKEMNGINPIIPKVINASKMILCGYIPFHIDTDVVILKYDPIHGDSEICFNASPYPVSLLSDENLPDVSPSYIASCILDTR